MAALPSPYPFSAPQHDHLPLRREASVKTAVVRTSSAILRHTSSLVKVFTPVGVRPHNVISATQYWPDVYGTSGLGDVADFGATGRGPSLARPSAGR
jgi:hypothetical protein